MTNMKSISTKFSLLSVSESDNNKVKKHKHLMEFKSCPHYEEIAQVIANNGDLDNITFELSDTINCKICAATSQNGEHESVCDLWVQLAFVQDIRPQMDMENKSRNIENLEKDFEEVTMQILKSFSK